MKFIETFLPLIIAFLSIIISFSSDIRSVLNNKKELKIIKTKTNDFNIAIIKSQTKIEQLSLKKQNDFDYILDKEDLKIRNTGRDLCSDESLSSFDLVDYCSNVIF